MPVSHLQPDASDADMPQYYFTCVAGAQVFEDIEGTELPDIDTARREARKDIQHLRQPRISGRRSWAKWVMRVSDESGTVLFELPFARRRGESTDGEPNSG